ncbi:MAG: PIG-L family deacetylase, partial [Ignavibacteria bacterium]
MNFYRNVLALLFVIGIFLITDSYCLDSSPKILIVTAHPDDDAAMAGVNYKIVHDLKGTVDLALITNGEGGYKYSTLAEPIYGLELTEESIGRKYLPEIRKKELEAGGKI